MNRRWFVAILGVTVLLIGCSQSQVLSTLRAVVSAAEIALPVIGSASGASPQTIAAIGRYLSAVSKATVAAVDILGGSDTEAVKSAKIIQSFASIASGCGCIQPGTPTQVVNVVNAVAQAVVNFLANFPGATPQVTRSSPPRLTIGLKDRVELASIRESSVTLGKALETQGKP